MATEMTLKCIVEEESTVFEIETLTCNSVAKLKNAISQRTYSVAGRYPQQRKEESKLFPSTRLDSFIGSNRDFSQQQL
ncbi:hypothetical protein BGX26_007527 [Mortierella sp. AD094]|nr:hypothetical protein BGX26_007527 [Mortierella sp. AD094]